MDEPVIADAALEMAREILTDTICECGHVAGDHVTDLAQAHLVAECSECTCELFEPVTFEVTRRTS